MIKSPVDINGQNLHEEGIEQAIEQALKPVKERH
jgi:hypothetical protein